jgi:tetratricopeptide (TPR) repeat protein
LCNCYIIPDIPHARKLQEQSLELRKRTFGEEHPSTITTMNNLAIMLRKQGEITEARDLQEKSLALSRQILGNDHPNTRIVMESLAETLKTMGETDRALELFSEAAKGPPNV